MARRACGFTGKLAGIWGVVTLVAGEASAQDGFRLEDGHIVVDRAVDWERWSRPIHATEVDATADAVRPRLVRKATDAIADMSDFTILIGDQTALDKLAKDIDREGRSMPLNIRTQPARVAGVPIVYQRDNDKTGVRAGDPITWYYYHGGIREVPRNAEAAPNVLDGDPTTYWEPTTEVSRDAWFALPEGRRGPVQHYVRDTGGSEGRVDEAEYQAAPSDRRRIEYHSHALEDAYVDIELGRVVPVRRIVLRFVDPAVGEPFRQFRVLGTASHFRDAALGLIARTNTPNEDNTVVTFDLDGFGQATQSVSSGHVADTPETFVSEGQAFVQLHRIRIALTDSRFGKFREVSAEAYAALPLEDQGDVDYYIVNAAGTETKVDKAVYTSVGPERRGRLIYYQRERPRLADVEVWGQGDNIGLGVVDGGGAVDLTGNFAGNPGFDGVYETNYLQLVWSPDARYADRGILTVDLGARFWLDFLRMVGSFSGEDEVATWISDGARDPNGNLRWTEVDRNPSGQGRADIEIAAAKPLSVRYVRTQIFSDAAGRAGGYNTGDNVRELQIYGSGYPSEVTLTSPTIELATADFLSTIEWAADNPDPDLVDVEIRTRTGDRLVEVTEYYGSGGEPKTESEYNKLPTSFRGPTVTRRAPGGGWSSWSQTYLRSGQRISSPSPRRYLQVQARLLSQSPDLAATLRSIRVTTLPPAAARTVAEVWPTQVQLGVKQDFEVYVLPTFIETDPDNAVSSRFDEIHLDLAPIQDAELLTVAIGDEPALMDGSAQQFTTLARRVDPVSGASTSWLTAADGTAYQALVDDVTGDSVRVYGGRVALGSVPQPEAPLHLHLPRKVASGAGDRTYYRRILEDGDEVPVDDDQRLLNELTYLNLSLDQQGQVLHFQIAGRVADGTPRLEAVDGFTYRSLADSLRGGVRYFRKLVGKGGESAYDRLGEPLTQASYNALPRAERGSVRAPGELVRVGVRAEVLLNGTTIDVSIRDSGGLQAWQGVDAGDATALRPGTDLSIAVPFTRQVVRTLQVEPRVFSPNGDGVNDRASIRFAVANVNQPRQVELRIFDLAGRLVYMATRASFGDQAFEWDGVDAAGAPVPPGLYLCRVAVDADDQDAARQADQRIIVVAY